MHVLLYFFLSNKLVDIIVGKVIDTTANELLMVNLKKKKGKEKPEIKSLCDLWF